MQENIVLRHEDPSVLPWVVPVGEGRTAEEVAEVFATSGWSLDAEADPAEVETDNRKREAEQVAANAAAAQEDAEQAQAVQPADEAVQGPAVMPYQGSDPSLDPATGLPVEHASDDQADA